MSNELGRRLIVLQVRIQKLKYIASHPVVAFSSILQRVIRGNELEPLLSEPFAPLVQRAELYVGERQQAHMNEVTARLRTLSTTTVSPLRCSNFGSRVQTDRFPATAFAGEEEAVVQTVFSIDPEFDLLRVDAVTFPIRRPGDFSRMVFGESADLGFQLLTTA